MLPLAACEGLSPSSRNVITTPVPLVTVEQKKTVAPITAQPTLVETTEVTTPILPDLGGREITVAVDNAYIPFNYILLGSDKATGFDYDIVDEICLLLNCTPVFVERVWEGMIQGVVDGENDMAAGGITITQERAEIADFSRGYINIRQRIMVRLDEDRFSTVAEFLAQPGMLIGSWPETTNYTAAIGLVGQNQVRDYDSYADSIQALVNKKIDAILIDDTADSGYFGFRSDQVKLTGEPLTTNQLGFIFPKRSDLVKPIDLAITELETNGTLKTLTDKYFSEDFKISYDDIEERAYADAE